MKVTSQELAINGGPPVINEPLPARSLISEAEKQAVEALFDRSIASGIAFGYNGQEEQAYCNEFAEYMGGGFADGVNSGTSAVYVALRALNPEPYTEVIVPPVTDPGGMMPVPLLNCIPVVADAAPGCYNTGAEQVEEVVSPLTSAIVVAHIGGEPADIEGIVDVARRHNLPVVEDCSQSHGAVVNGRKTGAFGDIGAFSTMFGKHHCTGGQGGLVFTRDENLYRRIRWAADRGKPFDLPKGSTNCMASLNFNMDELGAAIGRVQLAKLPRIIRRRREFAEKLRPSLSNLRSIRIPHLISGAEHVYWWWRLEVREDKITCSKDEYCAALAAEGVLLNPEYSAALQQRMQWFVERNVFGTGNLPWSSPSYKGDAERSFPCPNAAAAIGCQFNLTILESWGEKEAAVMGAAFAKVDAAYRRD